MPKDACVTGRPSFKAWQLSHALVHRDYDRVFRLNFRWREIERERIRIIMLKANTKAFTEAMNKAAEQVKVFGEILYREAQKISWDVDKEFGGNRYRHIHVDFTPPKSRRFK